MSQPRTGSPDDEEVDSSPSTGSNAGPCAISLGIKISDDGVSWTAFASAPPQPAEAPATWDGMSRTATFEGITSGKTPGSARVSTRVTKRST